MKKTLFFLTLALVVVLVSCRITVSEPATPSATATRTDVEPTFTKTVVPTSTPIPTVTSTVTPNPTVTPVAVREVLDAERVNYFVDTLLGINPEYQDPRISCTDMVGDGVVVGDTDLCIPRISPVGFCIEGSEANPCDITLVAVSGNFATTADVVLANLVSEQPGYIGGSITGPGYVFQIMYPDTFQRDYVEGLAPDFLWSDGNTYYPYVMAIPASFADIATYQREFELDFIACFGDCSQFTP